MWQKMKIIVCLLTLFSVSAASLTAKSFSKVSPSLPPDAGTCLVQQTTMAVTSAVQCATICLHNSACSLFCVLDDVCSLFSALVSNLWPGSSALDALHFTKCFSILPPANNIPSYSSLTGSGSNPLNAMEGYSCSYQSCFISNTGYENWWQLEYPQSLTITSVIIKQDPTSLSSVEVRVGNYSGSGYNNRYGYTSPPPDGLMIIDLPDTAIGSVFTISGNSPMSLCYVQLYIK